MKINLNPRKDKQSLEIFLPDTAHTYIKVRRADSTHDKACFDGFRLNFVKLDWLGESLWVETFIFMTLLSVIPFI